MEEIWKDIPGYEGYQASNLGRIRTHNKITYTKRHGYRYWKDRILKFKPSIPTKKTSQGIGYRVTLWKDGKGKDFLVARLIATSFLENFINTDMTVNHKDGNRLNNCIDNLEWLSRKDNIIYGFENGQYKQIKTTLINEKNKKIIFRSLSQADIFLKRNHGYCRSKFKKDGIVYSKDGTKYTMQIY